MIREIAPKLMPLHTPEVLSGGRIHQSPDAGSLKALSPSDFVPGSRTTAALSEHDQLTEQAQKWVAQTFYGALLKQMHDSPFKASWVDGGRGGEAFQPLLDQKICDHLARRSSNKGLVRSLVRKLEGNRAYRKQSKASRDLNHARTDDAEGGSERSPMRTHVAPGLRA